ncbi:MAG: hypothetical protein ACTHK4_03010 [Mycobacteriales bacterium]
MSEPVPRLRQGPPPEPGNGRKVLVGVAVFFALLVAFVLTLVFTIGIHNNGVKLPPSPTATATQ